MNAEIINLSNGYTAKIETDEGAESPWSAWDTEPPAWVHSDRNFTAYGDAPTLSELFGRLPVELFGPDKLADTLKALDMDPTDIFDPSYNEESAEGWQDAARDALPEKPCRFSAYDYFTPLAGVCELLGIPWLNAKSRGYSQGDCADCFFMATPEWLEITGVTKENAPAQLEAAHKLWSAWAWGDVYGVAEIIRPDGTECDDGSCWGFYGSDHKESGLLEHAESSVQYDIKARAKEAEESFRAACADIVTV